LKKLNPSAQLEAFLSACKISSEEAVSELSKLVNALENPQSQKSAAQLLKSLVYFISDKPEATIKKEFHFHFFDMEIPKGIHDAFTLKLLQLPSTFAPEEWSFTFFEGLSRYSSSEFSDKQMVELGCGNGWISLSVALKYNCAKIYGLDINPKAILCSKINLYLNAFDDSGELIIHSDGRSLLDQVEFHVSDLLRYFDETKKFAFDSIIGCIPQVLAPQEAIDNSKISHKANDEFLHSLSNYTSEQGFVEDKFGLGLIARAVEESIDLLKPSGKLILNLGERPRREVLERLVKRRGLLVNRIWTRKVAQANDTDIDSLVRLEKEMNHHFEFYTDLHSETAINARTAKLFASKGGTIYHNLSVYECKFDFYTETKLLFDELKNNLFAEAKVGLDLEYENGNKKEEKIRFLSELVKNLRLTTHFPYEDNQGELEFRKSLANFLGAYQHVNLSAEHIFIAPNIESLIENVMDVFKPESAFLSENLFSLFPHLHKEDYLICTPNCSKELNSLISAIRPKIVVAKISANTAFKGDTFQKIIEVCEASQSRLFIDISDCFDLSSTPESNGVFQYLSNNALPLHVTVICELSKNQIYHDLKTCFVISTNQTLLHYLRNSAEFSYSRSPYLSQLFYTILVKELTGFHMKMKQEGKFKHRLLNEEKAFQSQFISIQEPVITAFNHASIKGNELSVTKDTVRFDYGENELACPDDLKISILESFTRQHFMEDEFDPKHQILSFVSNRFGIQKAENIVYGNGVAPLFAGIAKLIKEEDATLILPEGAYGYFYATAQFYGVKIKVVPTHKKNRFILEKVDLEKVLASIEKPYLFLNFPLINPTGAFWRDEDMRSLLNAKGIEKTCLIIDTVFSGLEFEGFKKSTVFGEKEKDLNFILLGGISKEYSAGGIRFGYALSNFQSNLASKLLFTPHSTVKYAIRKLLSKYNEGDHRIRASLTTQISTLKQRANKLSTLLLKNGWDVVNPDGGLFLVASPTSLIGKKYKLENEVKAIEINATNISTILSEKINLLINNEKWTGIPFYCRFVLSVEDATFEEGLKRIERFHKEVI
jgi:methionine S-methyltransferase